jgi:uncharacterized membrane protein YphA (DoxX/SURF4 family)
VKILLLFGRVVLGAIFLYAAWTKLRQPWLLFAASIDSYQMLPEWAVLFIARTLPPFELALGALLVIGVKLRWVALASLVLLLAFWVSMLRAYIKGLGIDCGCFGVGEAVSILTLLRDGAMVAVAGALWWYARLHDRLKKLTLFAQAR